MALFVQSVAEGKDPAAAAKEAGYDRPGYTARALLRQAEVRKALVAATDARLVSEAAPLALKVIVDILNDPTAAPSVKGKLALGVLDRAGKVAEDPGKREKRVEDMTRDELAAYVAELDPATRAIDVTPSNARTLPDEGNA